MQRTEASLSWRLLIFAQNEDLTTLFEALEKIGRAEAESNNAESEN